MSKIRAYAAIVNAQVQQVLEGKRDNPFDMGPSSPWAGIETRHFDAALRDYIQQLKDTLNASQWGQAGGAIISQIIQHDIRTALVRRNKLGSTLNMIDQTLGHDRTAAWTDPMYLDIKRIQGPERLWDLRGLGQIHRDCPQLLADAISPEENLPVVAKNVLIFVVEELVNHDRTKNGKLSNVSLTDLAAAATGLVNQCTTVEILSIVGLRAAYCASVLAKYNISLPAIELQSDALFLHETDGKHRDVSAQGWAGLKRAVLAGRMCPTDTPAPKMKM